MDPYVTLAEGLPYQQVFAESSLMITDYSSVAFDFAYLHKPVVYFQFCPSIYKPEPFDYINKGFGEIADNMDALIDIIKGYINNGCSMSERYKVRVGNYFAFNDKNNCCRVHNALLALQGAGL
jgi:CDP-glycerol glycerophosphotransferase (TagB/SpsB family)